MQQTQSAQSADGAASDAAQAQLEEMKSSYTTEEQRRNHEGLAPEAVAPREVTFF
jgi:hypothetical protein